MSEKHVGGLDGWEKNIPPVLVGGISFVRSRFEGICLVVVVCYIFGGKD